MGFLSSITKGIGGIIGDLTGASQQTKAAQQAAGTQSGFAQQGIDALMPYLTAGTSALSQYGGLLGLNGADAQNAAISGIQNGAQFQQLQAAGNNNILQNASATGGLRGGNTQQSLGALSPAILTQLIQQQLSGLGGLASQGLNAGGAISGLLGQQGSAVAGGQIAAGNGTANALGQGAKLAGAIFGGGLF